MIRQGNQLQRQIARLPATVVGEFERIARPENLRIADGEGDDFGREEMNEAFNDLTWQQACVDGAAMRFDCGELSYHLSVRGFVYYLPAFITTVLRDRSFGWFERLLVPPFEGFEDVAQYFGDGSLFPFTMPLVERQRSRIDYALKRLTQGQRDCVAEYIEIAETHQRREPCALFDALLNKYVNFWHQCNGAS